MPPYQIDLYKLQTIVIFIMTSREEQIKLHHEKWKRWKLEMKDEEKRKKNQKQKPEQSAHNYAAKIMGKLQEPDKTKSPVSNNFQKQFESNACSVCFQLMIPPRNPMTLFPCGHNMCKVCLFVNGHTKQKTYKLKMQRCGLCCEKIQNHAENRSLMNLICTYTDNKHLIVKQDADFDDDKMQKSENNTLDKLRLRCDILEKQRRSIALNLAKQKKSKQVLSEVLQKLNSQKQKNSKEINSLQQQAKLIENFLKDKKQELEKIKLKILNTQQKRRVVQKTLEPLRTQKEKLQILEAAKLMQ